MRALWYVVNAVVFASWLMPVSAPKRTILRLFGATVGKAVVIKPRVNIKYPWKLSVGDYSWVGEGVWVDNLDFVEIGSNVCVSQGARFLTGNHNYNSPNFDLFTGPIVVDDGVWIGAFSVICPGAKVRRDAVLLVRSVARGEIAASTICAGDPARQIRERVLRS